MKTRFEDILKMLATAAVMMASVAASAQTAGTWMVDAGFNQITPKVTSGDMTAPALPGTKASVGSDTKFFFAVSYMITDNISTELGLGIPYKHDISGAGSIQGSGKLATTEVLPPTLFVQYRFLEAKSAFRPYVGLGLTYAYYQKETGSGKLTAVTNTGSSTPTTFKLDSGFGTTAQIGATYAFNDKWFAATSLNKTYLKTTAHYSTGQIMNIKLDPVAFNLAIGYKF